MSDVFQPDDPDDNEPEEGSGNGDSDLIDWDHLAGFAGGDRTFACEMIALFLENAGPYVDELEARKTYEGWKESAHKIKGAARSIGAGQVDAAAVRAEDLGPEEWAESGAEACREIRYELDRLRELDDM